MGIRIAHLAPLAVVLMFAACKEDAAPAKRSAAPETAAPEKATVSAGKTTDSATQLKAALANGSATLTMPGDTARAAISWIENDYDRALAAAKKAGLPLVVDMWAPWCHTCLSMKATVLKDPGLAGQAKRFVWAALDTDKPENAGALKALPVSAWPTFFIVAPDGSIAGRFLGSASVKQFRSFLAEGERAARAGDKSLKKDSAGWHLRAGDRHAASGSSAKAASSYAKALAAAPAEWPRRADVLVSQIGALYKAKSYDACAKLGIEKVGDTLASKSASTADFSYYATACAENLGDKPTATAVRSKAIDAITKVLADPAASLSADDRSDALRILRGQHEVAGDKEKALKLATEQRELLDAAASDAANPFFAMTYNWPRSEVYVYLDKGADLIPALRESATKLPKEYDPPYRLAWVLHKTGKNADALLEVTRAEKLAYGPRKGRVLSLKADILAAKGDDSKATLAARKAVLDHYKALPAGQRSDSAIAAAKQALAAAR